MNPSISHDKLMKMSGSSIIKFDYLSLVVVFKPQVIKLLKNCKNKGVSYFHTIKRSIKHNHIIF